MERAKGFNENFKGAHESLSPFCFWVKNEGDATAFLARDSDIGVIPEQKEGEGRTPAGMPVARRVGFLRFMGFLSFVFSSVFNPYNTRYVGICQG